MRRSAQAVAFVLGLSLSATATRAEDPALPAGFKKLALARPERLSIALGFGLGFVSQTEFHRGAREYVQLIMDRNPNLQIDRPLKSSKVTSLEFLARYYAPRHFFVESGMLFLQNGAQSRLTLEGTPATLSYENLVIELPLIVGMYWPLFDTFYVSAGLGPSLFVFDQSEWKFDLGRISSFRATRGGGFQIVGGSEWMIAEHLGISVMLRYRHAPLQQPERRWHAPIRQSSRSKNST